MTPLVCKMIFLNKRYFQGNLSSNHVVVDEEVSKPKGGGLWDFGTFQGLLNFIHPRCSSDTDLLRRMKIKLSNEGCRICFYVPQVSYSRIIHFCANLPVMKTRLTIALSVQRAWVLFDLFSRALITHHSSPSYNPVGAYNGL